MLSNKLQPSPLFVSSPPSTEATQAVDAVFEPRDRVADSIPAYISYIDDQLRYLYVNRPYEATFNLPQDRIIGRPVAEVVGPEAFSSIGPNLLAALAGEPRHLEPRVGPVGDERILSVDHIPDRDASGRVRGVIVYGHDITEIRRAEQALQKSEERLRLALAATPSMGFWDGDVANEIIYAGAAFATLYGIAPEDAEKGFKVCDFLRRIHPDDIERVTAEVQRTFTGSTDFSCEYRLVQQDSSVVWVLSVGGCSFDEHGKPVRFPGISIDITDRKRREDALLQSEKLAAVGRLASSIAHEINNPLEAVTNLIFLANQKATTPIVQQYLEAADAELRRVSAIVSQTLRFHKQSSKPQAIVARELFSTVLALFEARLRNCGIVIETSYRAQQPVVCFEGDVRQVLNNLVGNAIDAMDFGGHLTIRSHDGVDWATGRRGIVLTVADNGCGMSKEVVESLFEPFFTTKGIGGTGLGMWVSKEVVDRHQGTLRVRSSQRPDSCGSVFRLFLPS